MTRRATPEALRAARAGIARALLSLSRQRAERRALLGIDHAHDTDLAAALAALADVDLGTAEIVLADRPDVARAMVNLATLVAVPPLAWGATTPRPARATPARRGRGRAS